jgi:hypothetical protein
MEHHHAVIWPGEEGLPKEVVAHNIGNAGSIV